MGQLQDYAGEFRPDLRFTDFSPEFLSSLLSLYGRSYIAIDGFWYTGVKEQISNDAALKVDLWAWDKVCRYELKRFTALAGITGNGIDAVFKFLQLVPWMNVTEYHLELESPKRGLMTVTRCSILEALEREGQGREKDICSLVDGAVLRRYATYYNPAMRVEPQFLPPREKKEGLCCQWEFTLP